MSDKRTPTPKVRGNLPKLDESKSDEQGRELSRPPIEPYERGQSTWWGTTTYLPEGIKLGIDAPDKNPPGVKGLTKKDIEQLRREEPMANYAKGGSVKKYGSDTVVSCRSKHG